MGGSASGATRTRASGRLFTMRSRAARLWTTTARLESTARSKSGQVNGDGRSPPACECRCQALAASPHRVAQLFVVRRRAAGSERAVAHQVVEDVLVEHDDAGMSAGVVVDLRVVPGVVAELVDRDAIVRRPVLAEATQRQSTAQRRGASLGVAGEDLELEALGERGEEERGVVGDAASLRRQRREHRDAGGRCAAALMTVPASSLSPSPPPARRR